MKPFPFAIWPLQKSPKISWGATKEDSPSVYASYSTRPGSLEDALREFNLDSSASQYLAHLDAQQKKLGKSQPLFIIPPEIYGALRGHAKKAHIARTSPRSSEHLLLQGAEGTDGLPYGYDERSASIAGHAFHTPEGHTILIPRHILYSQDPHERGNSELIPTHMIEKDHPEGWVPIATMHAHPPSTLGSSPSRGDIGLFHLNGIPVNMIMYPYGAETESVLPGFSPNVMRNGERMIIGDPDEVKKSVLGSRPSTSFFYSPDHLAGPLGRDSAAVFSMNPKNIIIPNGRGGYVLHPDNVERGVYRSAFAHRDGNPATPTLATIRSGEHVVYRPDFSIEKV